ncbi:hypothetical protein SAMN05660484_00704 [Eubacterium ruminantium]|uniref:Uncharacterized protein n=1 Tax=Eubacterium ruminantium TaxID=42322 RepID=A0A1T4M198_9FIRM|nr:MULTISPECIES: hypothetical protein [Eubacterium]MCR5367429.1 hypothetical protein [Eubacterium sp.]SCW37859.1 hypothetical protein SAMN05660484_00704 [Eubacterium ruminantium]SDM46087.1 hypothetical protein SAMN04490370_103196 [Eubacterium ruminantium]SJZ60743.1 hypothetical protein SAMN02745110_01048 [Eubacterium ruminantium]
MKSKIRFVIGIIVEIIAIICILMYFNTTGTLSKILLYAGLGLNVVNILIFAMVSNDEDNNKLY